MAAKIKILLIATNTRAQGEPSLGLTYLASYIRKYSKFHLTIKLLLYLPKNLSTIYEFGPDVIGLSSLTEQYPTAIKYVKVLKEKLKSIIIIGGHHISICPESYNSIFDLGVISEGEETFLEIIDYFGKNNILTRDKIDYSALKKIDGLIFSEGQKIVQTEKRALIKDLDKIPYPARDLINMEFILNKDKNVFGLSFGRGTHMITSRGCPFNCLFCSVKKLWKTYRFHSAEYVIGEIQHLIETYAIELIHIYDDLFTLNRRRLRKIVQYTEKRGINKKVAFGMFGQAAIFDEEIAFLLRRMNVRFIEFGIESGSQRILDFLKNGQVKLEHIREAVGICKKYDITVGGTFIIGTPSETEEEMLATLKFIRELKLDKFTFFPLIPYPGTKLWCIAKQNGYLPEKINWGSFRMKKNDLSPKNLIDNQGQLILDKDIDAERFIEIYNLFERERKKTYDYIWTKVIPEEES